MVSVTPARSHKHGGEPAAGVIGQLAELGPAPAYWTPADQAELDLLIGELVHVGFLHRERCPECAAIGRPCAKVADAIETVIDWRDRRMLRARAIYLRVRQDTSEIAVGRRVA